MKYSQEVSIDPSAIGNATYTWRMNGIHDVDFAVGGHQPMGYDQMAAVYNRYKVNGARMTATCINTADTTSSYYMFINYSDSSTFVIVPAIGATPLSTLLEQKGNVKRLFTGATKDLTGNTALTRTYNPNNIVRPIEYQDHQYSGPFNGLPTNLHYGHLTLACSQGIDGGAVTVLVQFVFDVTWYEPKSPLDGS